MKQPQVGGLFDNSLIPNITGSEHVANRDKDVIEECENETVDVLFSCKAVDLPLIFQFFVTV